MTSPLPPEGLLEVGRIGKPHGVKGDVFVTFTSDVEQRRQVGARFIVITGKDHKELVTETIRAQADRFVVHFHDVADRTAAEALTNKFLYAEPLNEGDALWVHELIGSTVIDVDGDTWGTCVAVVSNPAHDIVELDNGLLIPIPFVESCDGDVTIIRPPAGLREALSGE